MKMRNMVTGAQSSLRSLLNRPPQHRFHTKPGLLGALRGGGGRRRETKSSKNSRRQRRMIALVLTRVSCGSATAAQGTDGSESWSLSRESTQCQLPRTPARTSLDKPTRRAHEFDFSELVTLERTLEDEVKSMTVPAVGAGSRLSKCPRESSPRVSRRDSRGREVAGLR